MSQAIMTTFHGPTDFKDSRIKASADAGELWTTWQSELNIDDNHHRARFLLCQKLGWSTDDWQLGFIGNKGVHVKSYEKGGKI